MSKLNIKHITPVYILPFFLTFVFWLLQKVPIYISAQVIGSTLASGTLRLIFNGKHDHFVGSAPKGSDVQSLVMEFIITLFLMFVVSGLATDNRAVSLTGLFFDLNITAMIIL